MFHHVTSNSCEHSSKILEAHFSCKFARKEKTFILHPVAKCLVDWNLGERKPFVQKLPFKAPKGSRMSSLKIMKRNVTRSLIDVPDMETWQTHTNGAKKPQPPNSFERRARQWSQQLDFASPEKLAVERSKSGPKRATVSKAGLPTLGVAWDSVALERTSEGHQECPSWCFAQLISHDSHHFCTSWLLLRPGQVKLHLHPIRSSTGGGKHLNAKSFVLQRGS